MKNNNIKPELFKFPNTDAETTLDVYISKIEHFFDNIDIEKKDDSKYKIEGLNTILNTNIDDLE